MTFPTVTIWTAGILLMFQMALALSVSAVRSKSNTWIGDDGHADLARATRRHANLAENSGIFIAGLLLLELSGRFTLALECLAAILILARVLHAIGFSRRNTNNAFRLAGGVATYLDGLALGALLLLVALQSHR